MQNNNIKQIIYFAAAEQATSESNRKSSHFMLNRMLAQLEVDLILSAQHLILVCLPMLFGSFDFSDIVIWATWCCFALILWLLLSNSTLLLILTILLQTQLPNPIYKNARNLWFVGCTSTRSKCMSTSTSHSIGHFCGANFIQSYFLNSWFSTFSLISLLIGQFNLSFFGNFSGEFPANNM